MTRGIIVKVMAEYPLHGTAGAGAWLHPANVSGFARTLEAEGYDAIAFTDHPAPSLKWLEGGGHETFDPYAALTFWAAATSRIRLMTHLAVLPYRNPFLHARSMMTVDVLSGGRVTFALGTGYLRSEFAALGVAFDERNALFDEAVELIRAAALGKPVTFAGKHFTAVNQAVRPSVVQRPHPPFWVGGNSQASLERVAAWGQGWAALMGPPELAASSRTASISSHADLAAKIRDLAGKLDAHGRSLDDVDILVPTPAGDLSSPMSVAERVDQLGALAALGVTWAGVVVPQADYEQSMDAVRQFAAQVLPQLA